MGVLRLREAGRGVFRARLWHVGREVKESRGGGGAEREGYRVEVGT